jgi:hypothetical protein
VNEIVQQPVVLVFEYQMSEGRRKKEENILIGYISARVNLKEKMKNSIKKNKVKAVDIIRKNDKMCPKSYYEMTVSAHGSLVTL